MKNKGYTLLELLGVIILLALLTILVFPSVINTIKRTNDKTDELSMKLISNAADLYIKNNSDNFMKYNGNKYVIEMEDLLNDGNLPELKDVNDKCVEVSYKNNKFNYALKDKGTCEQVTLLESICTPVTNTDVGNVPEGNYEAGDKYKCKVDPNKEPYTFYVLTTAESRDTTVNLIMDRNICDDGTSATEGNTCLVAWNADAEYNRSGPLTAMTYLYNATKTWTNVPALNYEYYDKEWQKSLGFTFPNGEGYKSFTSVNGEGKINETKFTETESLRARMPIYARVNEVEYGEVNDGNDSNGYLYENLTYDQSEEQTILGYWTLSSSSSVNHSPNLASMIVSDFSGNIGRLSTGNIYFDHFLGGDIGVRPVITLNIEREELPKEYQEVEYIEGTGTQYLIIDYIASGITSSKGKFQITNTSIARFLFGSRGANGYNFYGLNWGGGAPYKYYNSYSSGSVTTVQIDDKIHTFYKDKGILYVDNELITSKADIQFTTPFQMNVFACNDNGVRGYLPSSSRIFYLQFYDNNILKVYLVPCYRKLDGVIGMYDLVNDKFYTNLGTGTFLKGKDV